jgi:hypothetical protein
MDTHWGTNGMSACKASHMLGGTTTNDLEAVDCPGCLWVLLGGSIAAVDKIANRARLVTNLRIMARTGRTQ